MPEKKSPAAVLNTMCTNPRKIETEVTLYFDDDPLPPLCSCFIFAIRARRSESFCELASFSRSLSDIVDALPLLAAGTPVEVDTADTAARRASSFEFDMDRGKGEGAAAAVDDDDVVGPAAADDFRVSAVDDVSAKGTGVMDFRADKGVVDAAETAAADAAESWLVPDTLLACDDIICNCFRRCFQASPPLAAALPLDEEAFDAARS